MKQPARRLAMNGNEPFVDQGILNGWQMSWNPDDNRFYVANCREVVATFARWSNAVYYARTHEM
jgi:hypothetical protein